MKPTSHQNGTCAGLFAELAQESRLLVWGHEGTVATTTWSLSKCRNPLPDEVGLGDSHGGGMLTDHLADVDSVHLVFCAKPHAEVAPKNIAGPFLSLKGGKFSKTLDGNRA